MGKNELLKPAVHCPSCGCIVHRHERAVAAAKGTPPTPAPTVKPVSHEPVSDGATRTAGWRGKPNPEVLKQRNRNAV